MVKKILFGLVVVVGGFAIFVAMRPSHMHIERSITMKAPVESAYAQVADFHDWAAWSPWDKLDPAMTKTYSGPTSGEGAHYAWTGNKEVGEGEMTIKRATPDERIDIELIFKKPFAATNSTAFIFKRGAGDDTTVTWSMDGENNFMAKTAGVFMDMDKMVGDDFDKGLAALKTAAEADAKKRAEDAAAKVAAAAPPTGSAAPMPEPNGKPGAPPPVAPTAPEDQPPIAPKK